MFQNKKHIILIFLLFFSVFFSGCFIFRHKKKCPDCPTWNKVNSENPSSVLIQFFFNAKSEEYLHLLAATPKPERATYITLLNAMDVPNASKYNSQR